MRMSVSNNKLNKQPLTRSTPPKPYCRANVIADVMNAARFAADCAMEFQMEVPKEAPPTDTIAVKHGLRDVSEDTKRGMRVASMAESPSVMA